MTARATYCNRFNNFAKGLLSYLFVPPTLDQNIQDIAILIHCTPEVVNASVDCEEHFIQVPPVAGPRGLASQGVGISLAELETPFPDSLIAEGDTAHR